VRLLPAAAGQGFERHCWREQANGGDKVTLGIITCHHPKQHWRESQGFACARLAADQYCCLLNSSVGLPTEPKSRHGCISLLSGNVSDCCRLPPLPPTLPGAYPLKLPLCPASSLSLSLKLPSAKTAAVDRPDGC